MTIRTIEIKPLQAVATHFSTEDEAYEVARRVREANIVPSLDGILTIRELTAWEVGGPNPVNDGRRAWALEWRRTRLDPSIGQNREVTEQVFCGDLYRELREKPAGRLIYGEDTGSIRLT